MEEEQIYLACGKSDGTPRNCVRCRRAIERDNEFWMLTIRGSAAGSICRLGDCRKEENIRQFINGAVTDLNLSCDVEAAVTQVVGHYEKPER